MFNNPFSPIFGGKPSVFFGREDILQRFELAMVDPGSADRALFFTGTRGCGKTALLEQLSIRATAKGMTVFDLGPEDTLKQLLHQLVDFDETTSTISPQASINVLGIGGGISGGSVSKTRHIDRDRLQQLLLDACSKTTAGLFVTVDEVQKVPIDDMSCLCNAFQMASRKGHNILLAVAGLPFAHSRITEHEGCTYLRRASHEELGLFTWDEADAALSGTFSKIRGLHLDQQRLDQLNERSYGHPYLIQLLGYHLVTAINDAHPDRSHTVTEDDLERSLPLALLSYEQRALKPLLEELPDTEHSYLRAMSDALDADRLAQTADIADKLGVSQQHLSRARAHLIENGIIASPAHGKVMFCIPYLADYVLEEPKPTSAIEIARQRRV